MNAEIYSEWLRRQGLSVVRTASSCWHSQVCRVYQAFPYHQLIEPSADEIQELTRGHGAFALRYSLPPGAAKGAPCYHVVYTGREYGLENLSSWARKNVRRGLRNTAVQTISIERYVREGWALRIDTLARQKRVLQESEKDWKRTYNAISDLPGFEIWAAETHGKLAATIVIFRFDDWYYMVYQQCHSDYLRDHAPNALSFRVTEELVQRPGVRGIFYGMQSLDAPASVDEFKFRMGYEARPVRQCVELHPWLGPFVNRASYGLVRAIARSSPQQYWPAKAAGMFRVFLAGTSSNSIQSRSSQEVSGAATPAEKAACAGNE